MIASDGINVGAPLISGAFFGDPTFQDQFTTLDLSQYSDKMWPTDIGLQGSWHDKWVANGETQKYVSQDDLPPDSWSPFTITPDGLQIRAEEIPTGADHLAWSLMKKYDPTDSNGIKTTDDYPGFPNITVPWLPNTPLPNSDYLLESFQGTNRVLWNNYGQRWRSGILNTRNDRASVNQSRLWFVAKLPKGVENDGSGRRAYHYRSCAFPALWIYQQIRRDRGRNNEPRSSGLYQYNDPAAGTLSEYDLMEQGSFFPNKVYHAAHVHLGAKHEIDINYQESLADAGNKSTIITESDPTDNFYVFVLDITPEKIGYALGPLGGNITYKRAFTTRRGLYETQREVLLDPNDFRKLLRNSQGELVFLDEQLNDDGTPRTPDYMVLMNLAMDGQWLLNLMPDDQVEVPYTTLPDGRKYCDLTIKNWGIQPLIGARFVRPNGQLYEPYKSLAPATLNPWDQQAVDPIPPIGPVTGFSGLPGA